MRFPNNVLAVLADPRTEVKGDLVRIPFEIDRPVYEQLNVALRGMGGQWDGSKAVRAHRFPHRIEEHMRQCIAAGEYPSRYETGWFPTPHPLVMQVCDLAGIYAGMTVLEPSAGAGALTQEIARRGGVIDAVEVDERRADILREQGDCRRVVAADFLTMDPLDYEEGFHRIVMNPPFKEGLDHIKHAISHMNDDGILVAVMSDGLRWWSDMASVEFRAMVDEVGGEIEPLPEDSFAASGTTVRTCLVYVPGYAGGPLRTHGWHRRQPRQLDLFAA
ncbi:methyltransferase [Streptomyces sp. NPDC052179]|uniref:methyltransferase n=1 Tax=Streptomyces sp. NPDC052179 TaxID=3155680 RepID=UPI00341BA01F